MQHTPQEIELYNKVEEIKEECNKAIELWSTLEELKERILLCLHWSVQLSFDFQEQTTTVSE